MKFCYFGCQLVQALVIHLQSILLLGSVCPPPQKIRRCGAGGNLLLLRRTPRTLVTPLVVSVAEGRGPDAGRSAGRHVQSRSPLTNGGDCRRSSNQMLNSAAATALADGSSVPSPPNKLYAPDLEKCRTFAPSSGHLVQDLTLNSNLITQSTTLII